MEGQDHGLPGTHGEYPPLLAIVIYNGDQRWTAATDTADLFAPPGEALLGYLPRHRYLLLDLGALDPSGLPPDNVVSAIAMLEEARLSMATEKCILLTIEKCTLFASPRRGSEATGPGLTTGPGRPS